MSDLLEYKCPCCGGAIEFNSTLQKMKCPYCDTEFDMETVKEFNEAAANQQSDELNWCFFLPILRQSGSNVRQIFRYPASGFYHSV